MWYIFWILVAIGGFMLGGIAGAVGTGYLIIFKTFDWIGSASNVSEWIKVGEGLIILLFTKSAICLGFVVGGFFGAVPGILGFSKSCEENVHEL